MPTVFGSNAYEFVIVSDPFTADNNHWVTAEADAAASVFNGVNGHLATITSDAENAFLFGLASGTFQGFAGAWLGGNHAGWLAGPENGQSFADTGYQKWGGIEPNNDGFMYMSIGTTTAPSFWFDDSGVPNPDPDLLGAPHFLNDPVVGYFVEYENVPEPTTMTLLATGLAGLGASAWRRRLRK